MNSYLSYEQLKASFVVLSNNWFPGFSLHKKHLPATFPMCLWGTLSALHAYRRFMMFSQGTLLLNSFLAKPIPGSYELDARHLGLETFWSCAHSIGLMTSGKVSKPNFSSKCLGSKYKYP